MLLAILAQIGSSSGITSTTTVSALGLGIGFFVGVIGHEVAHARTADHFGDRTPRFQGRLSFNPKAHVDPLGTLILPGIFFLSVLVGRPFGLMFGWAKPTPLNPHQMRHPRTDRLWVSLAGPAVNLLLAILGGLGFRAAFKSGSASNTDLFLFYFVLINSFLFVVNMLPIPPLDGSKVLARFLSPHAAFRLEEMGQYGLLFLLLFFIFPPLTAILQGLVNPVCAAATGLHACI